MLNLVLEKIYKIQPGNRRVMYLIKISIKITSLGCLIGRDILRGGTSAIADKFLSPAEV